MLSALKALTDARNLRSLGAIAANAGVLSKLAKLGGVLPDETIVPIVNIELNENMEFACPPSTLLSGAQRTLHVGRRRVGSLQISSHTPVGEPRASPPARCPASLGEAA